MANKKCIFVSWHFHGRYKKLLQSSNILSKKDVAGKDNLKCIWQAFLECIQDQIAYLFHRTRYCISQNRSLASIGSSQIVRWKSSSFPVFTTSKPRIVEIWLLNPGRTYARRGNTRDGAIYVWYEETGFENKRFKTNMANATSAL